MPNLQHKRGTRAALDALAASNALRAGQLYLITDEQRIAVAVSSAAYETFAKRSEAADPWTRRVLRADFANGTTSFATIADGETAFSWTPPASSDFTVEAQLLLWTTTASNLPRPAVSIGAGQAFGSVEIVHTGINISSVEQIHGSFLASAANFQMPGSSLPAANTPWPARILVKGRSGATPGAIAIQMASETTGANVAFIKAGSEMRCRTV